MAIDSNIALIDVANAKTQLKITTSDEDTILADLINQASAAANKYCGRHLMQKSYVEYYNGNGGIELILKNFPVVSVTDLYVADANRTFDSTSLITIASDLLVKKEVGILELWNNGGTFLKGNSNIKVSYSAGWSLATVPYDLQLAVRKWVAQQYMKYSKKRYEVQSETIGQNTVTYMDKEIPLEVEGILRRYVENLYGAPDFSYAD